MAREQGGDGGNGVGGRFITCVKRVYYSARVMAIT